MDSSRNKQRHGPNVLITTYASSRGKCFRWSSNGDENCNKSHEELEEEIDKTQVVNSEKSTDLFRKIFHKKLFANVKTIPVSSKILVQLSQIRGPSGSIRGHRDVVRKSLENIKVIEFVGGARRKRNFNTTSMPTFLPVAKFYNGDHQEEEEDEEKKQSVQFENNNNCESTLDLNLERKVLLDRLTEQERNLCVVYTTSLGVIRRTFDDSKHIKSILNLNLIKYEERDIYLNREYKNQLKLRCQSIMVPIVFIDGQQVGGIKELETMNESGKLTFLMSKFKMPQASRELCNCCGNARYIACQSCNGSRKSTVRHFKFNSIALRCTKCDKNDGLIECPKCCQTSSSLIE